MNPMLIGALAGVAMGVISNEEKKKEAAKQKQALREQQKVEKVKQRFSHWTKERGENISDYVKEPSLMGEVMQGGVTGAAFGQGIEQAQTQDKLANAQINYYEANTPQQAMAPTAEPYPMYPGQGPLMAQPNQGMNLTQPAPHGIDALGATAAGQPRYMQSPGAGADPRLIRWK